MTSKSEVRAGNDMVQSRSCHRQLVLSKKEICHTVAWNRIPYGGQASLADHDARQTASLIKSQQRLPYQRRVTCHSGAAAAAAAAARSTPTALPLVTSTADKSTLMTCDGRRRTCQV